MNLKIVRDEYADSPRGWDNLGTMACWHGRYILGDEQPRVSPEEFTKDLPKGTLILPLYLYDHSGITISTSPFSCPWDSGQVGIIYVTPEKLMEQFSVNELTEETLKKATEVLQSEVNTYDQYLQCDVWGYILENECGECGQSTGESEESCFGFYGDCLDDIKSHLDEKYHDQLESAWENRS